ncbi:DMT family transporter [Marinovum sp. 2_MG-2023]|uniref:DMT family transporter n=1 Tax=Roseobacteraceae TaxID=2854170 RepID=UPI001FD0CBE8|nr:MULTISPECIES: DMT family transporter [Roseobacteraceae]MCJ7871979.1 DMT family transporter [Phaeobacter sp. J2-8]MDO6731582.1 DMT family transporter [Marinovum sp. 2_MG-2023]MDO6778292.1 DMT family transporter [Marinovum sp. 1_MG-2023]
MNHVAWRISLPMLSTVLVVAYTLLITCSDAITKYLAQSYKAPQLLCIVALLIVVMSLGSGRIQGNKGSLRTSCPGAMAWRAGLTVLATVMFFNALATLVFAEVFVFIALVPLLSAMMSGPILGEHVRLSAWIALGLGFVGVLFMVDISLSGISKGHICAFVGSVSGTASIVLARYIGRREDNSLAQVFYPQAAVFLSMLILAPFGWQPMSLFDLALSAACAVVLFSARLLLVIALRHLAAYVVTPLMNLQFVWMVLIGLVFFNEVPAFSTFVGAVVVMVSGLYLALDKDSGARSLGATAPDRTADAPDARLRLRTQS